MSIEQEIKRRGELVPELDRYSAGSRMSFPVLVSGSRQVMVNHNLKHGVAYVEPEFPRLFTGAENKLASFSATITKLDDHDYIVHDIIRKDEYNAIYVLKRKESNYFIVIERYEVEEVSESFGIAYNNKILDRSKIGDVIKAGTTIQKSTNFDKHMNYRYVKNLNVGYAAMTMNLEDGILLMNDADKLLSVVKARKQRIKIANNDIFLNLKGTDSDYNPFPDVGEEIDDGIFAVIRKKTNDKILSSMSKKKLQRIESGDRTIYANGTVIKYDFYHNKDFKELIDSRATKKLNALIRQDRAFHKEVYKKLGHIIANYEYSDKLAFLYNRSFNFLNPQKPKTDDHDAIINNIIMDVSFLEHDPCSPGTKLVGRYGNKGVVCKILPKEQSWYTESGEPIHIILSSLGVPARLNIGQAYETFTLMTASRLERSLFYNHLHEQVDAAYRNAETFVNTVSMAKLPLEDKFDLLIDFVKIYNKDYAKEMRKTWKTYDSKQRAMFMHKVFQTGIHICFDSIDCPNIETLEAARNWCIDNGINVNPERIVFPDGSKTLKKILVGKQAIIRLKQDPTDKYSVRGSGVLNAMTATPYKSNAKKEGLEPNTDTAVRIGEFESAHLQAANQPEADAALFDMYSNSPTGRQKFADAYDDDSTRYANISDVIFSGRKKNREALDGLLHVKGVCLKITRTIYSEPRCVIDLNRRRKHYEELRRRNDKNNDLEFEKITRGKIKFKE